MEIGVEASDSWPQFIVVDGIKYNIDYEVREPSGGDHYEGYFSHIWSASTRINGKKVSRSERSAFESAIGLAEHVTYITGSDSKRVSVDLPISTIIRNGVRFRSWSR